MARPAAKKAELNPQQSELFFDPKRDLNPFWSSSLFSDVYLKNDLPREYKVLWENDEIGGFYNFYQGFVNLCHDLDHESFESWREADTVKNWIVPVMNLLGWENNSERHQNSYIDNTSFTVEENGKKQVYRPDLIYFDLPQHKAYTQKEKDHQAKLREARDQKTGSKIVVEAKYWNRLSAAADKFKTKESDDSASGLGPELQTLKYMEIFDLDFGILTDGKTWKIFHQELSQGMDRRCYEFDLGNLKELALDLGSDTNEQKFRNYAKYFYYFFAKPSIVGEEKSRTAPFLYEILEYSKKYAHSIEEDLKKRFIISMGLTCNALQRSAVEAGTKVDLETIRNVAESHLFNILFTKSCEVRKILPIQSINYLKVSLHEVIEYLTEMKFDPDKNWDDFLRDFRYGEAFGGKKFSYEGNDIFNRFINLYEVIHDGTDKNKDFGFEIQGFKESIFSKEEWAFAKKHKICNRDMITILFNLNFIESQSPDRKYQQIPYSYFTPRQLGSIYESFLEFRIEKADADMVFTKGQWKPANLKSNVVKGLKLADNHLVKKGELFFSPDNTDRKMTGSYYTPDTIVKYIIEKTLTPLTENKTASQILEIKLCDPAMGSGHFLAGAIDYLVGVYRRKWSEEFNDDLNESLEETSRKILDACIFGIDINPRAIKLGKMSLWLTSAYPGKKLENLNDQLLVGNSLLEKNFNWKKAFRNVFDTKSGFDALIGNPPWISLSGKHKQEAYSDEVVEELIKTYGANSYMPNTYEYFIIQFLEKSAKNGGRIGIIIPDRFGFNGQFVYLREKIIKNYTLENLVYKAEFPGVVVDTLIFICENKLPKSSNSVQVSEGFKNPINVLQSDYNIPDFVFSYSTSNESKTVINKINTLKGLKRISEVCETTSGFGGKSNLLTESKENRKQIQVIKGNCISKYNVHKKLWFDFSKENLTGRTTDKTKLGATPKVLLRKTGLDLIAAFDDSGIFPEQSLYFLYNIEDEKLAYYLLALLNSQVMNFYYQEVAVTNKNSIAQLKKVDLDNFPVPFDFDTKIYNKIVSSSIKLAKEGFSQNIQEGLDGMFFEIFDFTKEEISFIKNYFKKSKAA